MDLDATATLSVARDRVLEALADLGTYPAWLTIVGAAVPAPARQGDTGPAWAVDLVARVGPLSRRKRVRMVRTHLDGPGGVVRFERSEQDGRAHNDWVLTARAATASADGAATDVALRLHYGGGARIPGADHLLGQEVRRAGARLEAFLARSG